MITRIENRQDRWSVFLPNYSKRWVTILSRLCDRVGIENFRQPLALFFGVEMTCSCAGKSR